MTPADERTPTARQRMESALKDRATTDGEVVSLLNMLDAAIAEAGAAPLDVDRLARAIQVNHDGANQSIYDALAAMESPREIAEIIAYEYSAQPRDPDPGRCRCGHYHSLTEDQDDAGCSVCTDDHPWQPRDPENE